MSKHAPFSSETSKPHGNPEHVDQLHFGEGGRKDNELTKGTSHITDKNAVDYGREAHEARESDKATDSKDKK